MTRNEPSLKRPAGRAWPLSVAGAATAIATWPASLAAAQDAPVYGGAEAAVVDDTFGSLYVIAVVFALLVVGYMLWTVWQHRRTGRHQGPPRTGAPADSGGRDATPRYAPADDPDNPFRQPARHDR